MSMRASFLALGILISCAAEESLPEVEPLDPVPALEALVRLHFGPDVDPDAVVARVDSREIAVVDVALWLEHYPGLTVEQAVADLADTARLADAASGSESDYLARVTQDARVNGLVGAWTRTRAHAAGVQADPETVDEIFRLEPELAHLRTVPELVSATHILFIPVDGVEQDVEWVHGLMASWSEPLQGLSEAERNERLVEWIDPLRPIVGEKGYRIRAESRLVFARDDSLHANWNSRTPTVVEPFAEAAFAMQPGEAKGPVETAYGLHFILVDARTASEQRDDETARARARTIAQARADYTALRPEIDAWIRATSPVRDLEVIARISADAVERLQSEEEQRRRRR